MGSGFETTPHRRVLWLRRVPILQGLSFPPSVRAPRRLCRSGGLVGTGRGAAGAVPRASRAGSPGSCGHVRDLSGGAGFGARKPRGRQHRTRRARPSGAGGESRPGGLREEVTRKAWPWTWLESRGGIPAPRQQQGRPRERPQQQARVDSAPPWGPQRAAARTAFLYSRLARFSLWSLSSPPASWLRFHHSLLD